MADTVLKAEASLCACALNEAVAPVTEAQAAIKYAANLFFMMIS
jgi:hypothetical protein